MSSKVTRKRDVPLPIVFDYLDYREYLRTWYQAMKASPQGFSFRALADRAGFSSQAFLPDVIRGRRRLSPESVDRCIAALGIAGSAAEYFRTLVRYNQESTGHLREEHLRGLLRLQAARGIQKVARRQSHFYGSWAHIAVREAAVLPGLGGDPARIGAFLRPPLAASEVRKSLDLLLELGLLLQDGKGRFRHSSPRIEPGDIDPRLVRAAKRQMLLLALEQLSGSPAPEAHISSVTLSISRPRLARIRALLERVRRELLSETATDEDAINHVVQVSFQMIPLSIPLDDFCEAHPRQGAEP